MVIVISGLKIVAEILSRCLPRRFVLSKRQRRCMAKLLVTC